MIDTIEDAAAVKTHFETYYHELLDQSSGRSLRRSRLEDHLAQSSLTSPERADLSHQLTASETDHLRQLRALKTTSIMRHTTKGVSNAHFQEIRLLGRGSFGQVKLVTDINHNLQDETNSHVALDGSPASQRVTLVQRGSQDARTRKNLYAMKVIRKAGMIRNSQEAHLRAERDFLVKAEGSQWVVPLIASFQDNSHLYLVMEFMVGGDFLQHLLRHGVLTEQDTQFYMAEMVLAIEETHKMMWIHRDIKPDNFLISSSGHLKISDYGLAFDGHWSHDKDYYDTVRYSVLERYGIKVGGDVQDQQEHVLSDSCHPVYNLRSNILSSLTYTTCVVCWTHQAGRVDSHLVAR
jgi:protein-serine/threonine kinase